VVFGIYSLWHLAQLILYVNWVQQPKQSPQPLPVGIWKTIRLESNRFRKRGKSRKKRLRNILDGFQESTNALPDATVVLREDWNIEWSNPASTNLLGISKSPGKADTIFDYIDHSEFREYVEAADFSHSLQIPGAFDPESTLEIRIVEYGGGKLLLQARDITRLSQLENVRRDFVANVSHELRTPLTVVSGYLETLIDADDDDEIVDWKPILRQMNEQSGRLKQIVEDLLTLSRLETRDRTQGMSVIDVPELVRKVADDARLVSGEENHRFSIDCDDNLRLLGSEAELLSAFSNLVVNAVRYTPASGKIDISWQKCGVNACFSVTDTGVGIPPEHLPRLTERFYRVNVGRSRETGGTGLGLAIVKHILIRHGGRLNIESEPGVGSQFTGVFPAARIRTAQPD